MDEIRPLLPVIMHRTCIASHFVFHNFLPPPLGAPDELLVHRPRKRAAHGFPRDAYAQPVKEASHALLGEHLLSRLYGVPIAIRHELYACLDRIKRIGDRGAQPCCRHAGDEVDAHGGAGRELHARARRFFDLGRET